MEIALRAGDSTSGIQRGRQVACCARTLGVVSDLGGLCPPSPPAGDKAVPYNPSQTALLLAAGRSNRAVVGRVPKLLDSGLGAGSRSSVRSYERGMAWAAVGVLREQVRGRFGSGVHPHVVTALTGEAPQAPQQGLRPGGGSIFLIALRARAVPYNPSQTAL